MSNKTYANMLENFLEMDDSELFEKIGIAARTWGGDFRYKSDLAFAYEMMNTGRVAYGRRVIEGVIAELNCGREWTAEEILRREG